jgi:hypothetical protein
LLPYRVEKMKLSKDKTAVIVNDTLTLRGIPAQVFEYRLGNRSALDWVIDQYQVEKDATGTVTSDPNRPDDPRYIVDLVAKVVRVSMRTVEIVKSLPTDFGGPPRLEGAPEPPAAEEPKAPVAKPTEPVRPERQSPLRSPSGGSRQMRIRE